jgi:6-phosphogluconolactonase/glucosamine-6-phosphate isomerase/deaminase
MRILSFKNVDALATQTEVLFREMFEQTHQPCLRGFFPTGKSAEKLYERFRANSFWKKKFQLLQIDEFAQPEPIFFQTLLKQIIEPLELNFEAIQPLWSDDEMAQHIERVITRRIDFCLLGLGPNGHIGFHEPDCGDEDFLGGRVHLSEQSFQRVQAATSPWALTFGAGSFLKAQKIIMIATGAEKELIFKKFTESPATADIPATLLKAHPDFTVLTTFDFKS